MKWMTAMATVFLTLCGMTYSLAAQKQVTVPVLQQQKTPVAGAYEIKLPDLTVKLELTTIKHNVPGKGLCYTVSGNYTVTNIGNAPAGRFLVRCRFKDAIWDWHDPGGTYQPGLKPGESLSGLCSPQLRSCPVDEIFVGYEVTVDPANEIKETQENNNSVKKTFPSPGQLKKVPHKTKKLN